MYSYLLNDLAWFSNAAADRQTDCQAEASALAAEALGQMQSDKRCDQLAGLSLEDRHAARSLGNSLTHTDELTSARCQLAGAQQDVQRLQVRTVSLPSWPTKPCTLHTL